MRPAVLLTVASRILMQEIVSSRHVDMPARHPPAPEASGPLSNTTNAQSLCCELPRNSSASLSVLLSTTPYQRICNAPKVQSCHPHMEASAWQQSRRGCRGLPCSTGRAAETAPEDAMEGLAEELMRFVQVCCQLQHLRRGWGKRQQPHVYQIACALRPAALSHKALTIRSTESQASFKGSSLQRRTRNGREGDHWYLGRSSRNCAGRPAAGPASRAALGLPPAELCAAAQIHPEWGWVWACKQVPQCTT